MLNRYLLNLLYKQNKLLWLPARQATKMKGCYLHPPCTGVHPSGALGPFSPVHSLLCRIWAVEVSCRVFCSSAWLCFDCWQTYGNFDPRDSRRDRKTTGFVLESSLVRRTLTHTFSFTHSNTDSRTLPSIHTLTHTRFQADSHRLGHPLSHIVSETLSPFPTVSWVIPVEL